MTISNLTSKRILHYFGVGLGVAGIAFVGWQLLTYRKQIDLSLLGAPAYLGMLFLSIAYGISNIFLAAGWHKILSHLGAEPRFGWTVRAYAQSQLAKYIPGNIFHLVGRQALGAAEGIPHRILAKSAAVELIVIALCTGLFAPLLLPIYWPAIGAVLGPLLFVAITVISLLVVKLLIGGSVAQCAAWYGLFLAISGTIFMGAYLLAGGSTTIGQMPAIAAAYVLAWLAGLITPGAPAGIGVRETVLLFLLAGFASAPTILLAVMIGRAVTVLGDLGFYLVGGYVDAR